MKMHITTTHEPNYCRISYDDPLTGERIDRRFMAPALGGYVREWSRDGSGPQVCEGLASMGVTLHWSPSMGPLASMVRREYRRAVRAWRKALA